MQEIHSINPDKLAGIQALFFDIDETLSTQGKLTSPAYEALWNLHEAGVHLVPVTGRSGGWCDHIGRFWPVDAVVGENGAFYFWHDGEKLRRRFLHSDAERGAFRHRLEAIGGRILAEVNGCAIASDQRYRECDLAIDFCEDVAPLAREQAARIESLFEESGAHAKISSIHVNGWFGDFDKLSTVRLYARERLGIDLKADNCTFAFCGDSPNDAPMFGFFGLSFAVANIRSFLDIVSEKPAFITTRASGAGFSELANAILGAKGIRKDRP